MQLTAHSTGLHLKSALSMEKSQAMIKQQIIQIEQIKCRQAEFIPILIHSISIPAIYVLQGFIVIRTENESGIKTRDNNEKKTDLDYKKKK